ncbi:acyl-CoA dehydrogenase [Actinospongicola halichondriae]|uniref:acyl-CoA dehydrogenase n=1 Tax=Actinospongicola halichondriae TaxID=3236844 RepID=UPI003D3D2FB9
MADYLAPFDDIRFVLSRIAGLGDLSSYEGYEHAEADMVFGVLEECARFMQDKVAPLNRIGDEQTTVWNQDNSVTTPEGFIAAYQDYVAAGWGGVALPEAYGGGGFPWLVGIAMQEMLTASNEAFSMAPLLTQGAIDAILTHSDEIQKEIYLPKMVTGEWTGTMNLSEPQAGSDVGAVRTRAEKQDDGSYKITGTKIWISWGEHDMADNIIHLVLARTPEAPPGTKGISMFIVPKFLVNDDGSLGEKNGVVCQSIEHKLGIKASPTCVLDYDEATGYIVGEENRGMSYMFTMMNNARLSVGLQGLAVGDRAYQDARQYASERLQGRAIGAEPGVQSPIIEHPDVRRMMLTMKSQLEALRAVVYRTAQGIDVAHKDSDEQTRTAAQERVDLLIPICKGWGTDLGVEITSTAIQIFGGMGYVEETGVAQHFRDARIAPIYEGTNGIQAMDLVGRKLPMRGGGVVADFLEDVGATITRVRAAGDDYAVIADELETALGALRESTDWIMANGLEDVRNALAGATPYLRQFGIVTGGWMLAESALEAKELLAGDGGGFSDEFLTAKYTTARFYATQILPQAAGMVGAVTAGFEDLMELSPTQF